MVRLTGGSPYSRLFSAWVLGLASTLTLLFASCGSQEDAVTTQGDTTDLTTKLETKQWSVLPLTPIAMALMSQNDENPNVLVSTQRSLLPHEYDALMEPEFSGDRKQIATVVTGIGLDIVDLQNNNLVIGLGLAAREFQASSDGRGGQFSTAAPRIFAAQGENLVNSQTFAILNTDSPNYILTGLGLRLKEARVKNLVLQRKAVSAIMSEGDPLSASKTLILPPGWAAVSLILKIVPKIPEGKTIFDVKVPYIQDALLYVGQWGWR